MMVRECVIVVHSEVWGEKDTGLSLSTTELWAEQDPHVDPNLLLTTFFRSLWSWPVCMRSTSADSKQHTGFLPTWCSCSYARSFS